MAKNKIENFESSLRRLQEISEQLEDIDLGLDDSIKLYEEGTVLSSKCFDIIKNAELKITELKNKLESDLSELGIEQ